MRNPLSDGLLDVAVELVRFGGSRRAARQAALRRAASTAYYALFHTVCQLCGDGLRLWTVGGDDLQEVYRSLDHGRVADVLAAAKTGELHADLHVISGAFAQLRKFREDADYSQPGRIGEVVKLLDAREVETLIDLASQAVALLDALPTPVRRRLAVLLVTGPNKRRRR